MGKNVVVIGSQWGDEGKGKVVDLLTDKAASLTLPPFEIRDVGTEDKAEFVRRLGADVIINRTTDDLGAAMRGAWTPVPRVSSTAQCSDRWSSACWACWPGWASR